MTLTKRQASLIAALRSRHGRKDSGLCLCDGLRACSEVIELRPDLLDLIVIREDFQAEIKYPVDPVILPAQDFDKLTQTVNYFFLIVRYLRFTRKIEREHADVLCTEAVRHIKRML